MIIKNGTVFCDDGIFRNKDIEAENGVITAIGDNLPQSNQECFDASECYVVPGLVDIHTHGAMGADFSDGTPEAFLTISKYLLKCGVTSFLATTMTVPEEQLSKACITTRSMTNVQYKDQSMLRGIQLEGPFFSHEKRGAQNADYLVKPDIQMFKRLNEASGGNVRLIAIAPEEEGGLEFIEAAAPVCAVSLGHSVANYDIACKAFSHGATHVTHLFNGMNPFSHRESGIIGAAFDNDVYVELIPDGIHINPTVVRIVFQIYDENKVCLISDSIRACGLTDGEYELGGQIVTVVGRKATIENGSLAGSVTPLSLGLRRAVEYGIPLEKALKAVTINPAKSIGIDAQVGSLTIGKRADILILTKDLEIKQIVFGGEMI